MYKNKYKILKKISPCWAAGDPGWTAVTKIPTSLPPVNRMPTLPAFWKLMNLGSGLKNNIWKNDFIFCCFVMILSPNQNKQFRAKYRSVISSMQPIKLRSAKKASVWFEPIWKNWGNLKIFATLFQKKTYIGPLFLSLASSLLEWRLVTP